MSGVFVCRIPAIGFYGIVRGACPELISGSQSLWLKNIGRLNISCLVFVIRLRCLEFSKVFVIFVHKEIYITATQSLKIYEVLNKHFKNPEDAKTVVEQIEQIVEEKVEAKKDILATKADLGLVKEDLLNARNELSEKIHQSKIETIIWIVGVGVIQFILTILSKKFL